ncbi:Nucleoporin NUP53 [Bagarius yarrelli]|uniref:Nucleoporin NUP53 n=1 Tax=Bagarius yarrelli TaxID=175774 RepID=A0A556V1G2_BAGYA|nr:Nucleoporin NUP53 [Bagarius yarrelli]
MQHHVQPAATNGTTGYKKKTSNTHRDLGGKMVSIKNEIKSTQNGSLQEVFNVEECDHILIFCPVVSRVTCDIKAAMDILHDITDTKPAVLVVLHHTLDPECVVADSSRIVTRENLITVDALFNEDQGILTCMEPMSLGSPSSPKPVGGAQFLPGFLMGDLPSPATPQPRPLSLSVGIAETRALPFTGGSPPHPIVPKDKSGAPPVRSIYDDLSSSAVYSVMQTPLSGVAATPGSGSVFSPASLGHVKNALSPAQVDPFFTQGDSLTSEDHLDETWVTVFGKALSKDGKIFGDAIMIGVKPCIDKCVMECSDRSSAAVFTPPVKNINSLASVSTPRSSMRPLSTPHTHTSADYQVVSDKETPRKDDSFVSKAMEYMFGCSAVDHGGTDALQYLPLLKSVWLSSQDAAHDFATLKKYQVTHILNVAYGVENAFPDLFIYKTVSILDLPDTDIISHLHECAQFIDQAKSEKGVVLVHCNTGVSRAVSVVIGYLMWSEGRSYDDAFSQVIRFTPDSRSALKDVQEKWYTGPKIPGLGMSFLKCSFSECACVGSVRSNGLILNDSFDTSLVAL